MSHSGNSDVTTYVGHTERPGVFKIHTKSKISIVILYKILTYKMHLLTNTFDSSDPLQYFSHSHINEVLEMNLKTIFNSI